MTNTWERWPSTADGWIEFTKDAYAASLISEQMFNHTIDRLLRNPTDFRGLVLDLPMASDLQKALIHG